MDTEKLQKLRLDIDTDAGLKSKRKQLTIVSIILLCFTMTGAKVLEVNTIFVKMSLDNERGIPTLLAISVLFLLIRYYNYAKPYQDQLYRLWSARMMRDDYFFTHCHESDALGGLENTLAPEDYAAYNSPFNYERSTDHHYASTQYVCELGKRFIEYAWGDQAENLTKVAIKRPHLFSTLKCELIYQASSFFTHRENLDLCGPYCLGFVAIVSLWF